MPDKVVAIYAPQENINLHLDKLYAMFVRQENMQHPLAVQIVWIVKWEHFSRLWARVLAYCVTLENILIKQVMW